MSDFLSAGLAYLQETEVVKDALEGAITNFDDSFLLTGTRQRAREANTRGPEMTLNPPRGSPSRSLVRAANARVAYGRGRVESDRSGDGAPSYKRPRSGPL
jgi:hypothetical protein